MFRFARLIPLLSCALVPFFGVAQDTTLRIQNEQIDGPSCASLPEWYVRTAPRTCTEDELGQWLDEAKHWREEHRIRVGLSGSEYERPELQWTQSSFVQPQMMVHDRFFFDPAAGKYTVDRYLQDVNARYGGIDSVLVWPTYPNIGIDDRNQYDLFADMPGGIRGIRSFVDQFHAAGVKVLFPTMLWDQGTRVEGTPDAEALAKELAQVGADGVNGDTLEGVPSTFRTDSDALHHPLALEPELGPASDEMLNWNNMSWGYWKYGFVPTISRYKWLEARHMVNISDRWNHDHTDDLQFAFFNGIGFESWENIWSIWNGITPRDAEALRRTAAIERFGKAYLVSPQWRPFAPTRQYGVFASEWPGAQGTLWTLVNRNHYAVNGRQLAVQHVDGMRYFDLWHGTPLEVQSEGGRDVLSFEMEADGFGSVLAAKADDAALTMLLATQHSAKPLATYSHQWLPLPQKLVPTAATPPAAKPPAGMSHIPAADFLFRVNGIEIEGTNDDGVDVQYEGEPSPRRYHEMRIHIPAFWMDTTPVTNKEFKRFLDATHYHPVDDHNFLRDWVQGTFPKGWDNKPVTWVSLEDARAYAHWAGKRLPHEWEWQYAAQGTDGRVYPWGNAMVAVNMPMPDTGRRMQPPSDVNAHPGGASPFGVQDLVGNVWQWTDEWMDDHTRSAILRGGSHYQPQGSRWYFPQAYKLSQHGKYLLMAPSLDRSGTVGFRCVMDAAR